MATTHNLKVRAELDASQARQQIESLKNALGGFGNNGTLDFSGVEKALSNLASSLTGFKAQMDKAAQEMSKIQYKGGGGGGGTGGTGPAGGSGGGGFFSYRGGSMRGMHRGAYGALAYGAAGVLDSFGGYLGAEADMLEAQGASPNEIASKRYKARIVGQAASGAKTIGSFAMTGAMIGSVIPGLGTAAGAGIGAALGTATAALNVFSDNLTTAAAALASATERFNSILATHSARTEARQYKDLSNISIEELQDRKSQLEYRRNAEVSIQNSLASVASFKNFNLTTGLDDNKPELQDEESKKIFNDYAESVTRENNLNANLDKVNAEIKRRERAAKQAADAAERQAKIEERAAKLAQEQQDRLDQWKENFLDDMEEEDELEKLKVDAQKMSLDAIEEEIEKRKNQIGEIKDEAWNLANNGPMTLEKKQDVQDLAGQANAMNEQIKVLEKQRRNIEEENDKREKAIRQLAEMQIKGESILTKIGKMGGYMSKMEMQSMTNANNNPVVSKMRDMENVLKQIEHNTVGVGTLG